MKVFKTSKGILIENEDQFFLINEGWDQFINDDNLLKKAGSVIHKLTPVSNAHTLIENELLPPIGSQEIWASGVTYLKSKSARMEESRKAGGDSFYNRVYDAERPELFFKSTPYRAVGSGQKVKIRKDAKWNVPEPELTLMITSSGKIIGYTIGNDMSSRDIEGENPLYLPQAKCYDGAAAVGPCIYLTESPLPNDTEIVLEILRNGRAVFFGTITIDQIKRKFSDLVQYLYREMTFSSGSLLMTGTGIVPPNDFTLEPGDQINITIATIGTLSNVVA